MFHKYELEQGYYYRLFFGMLRIGVIWNHDTSNSNSIYFSLGIWKPELTISFGWKKSI